MSKLIKRKSISGAPTQTGPAPEQNVADIIKPSFDQWLAANFPDIDADDSRILLAAYIGGVYTAAKLLTDPSINFVKSAFEAHGAAINAAKAPPIA